jgi:flagellar L-ring protein FlgH
VQDVLPNGHLLVAGEKQIGINSNVDVLKFSGTIDPRHIRPGNTIASTQVANARIESRGRGAVDEALSIGWLGRFFLNVFPF